MFSLSFRKSVLALATISIFAASTFHSRPAEALLGTPLSIAGAVVVFGLGVASGDQDIFSLLLLASLALLDVESAKFRPIPSDIATDMGLSEGEMQTWNNGGYATINSYTEEIAQMAEQQGLQGDKLKVFSEDQYSKVKADLQKNNPELFSALSKITAPSLK